MKKILFFTALFLTINFTAHAQLQQTKWKGRMFVPNETDSWLNFKKDTLEVFVPDSSTLLETMTYTVSGDTLLLKKISGQSRCDAGTTGKHKWSIKGADLFMTPISDDCEDRYRAWTGQPFIRQKD